MRRPRPSLRLILLVVLVLVASPFAPSPGKSGDGSTDSAAAQTTQATVAQGEHIHEHGVEELTPPEKMLRILEHKVENTPYIHEYPFPELKLPQNWIVRLGSVSIDFSPSRHVVYMWLSALITFALTLLAVRQNARGTVPRGFGNMIESVIVFVRDEVAMPFLGKDTARFMPLLLTFFFFISCMNVVGILPFGAASTGNLNVTGGLALTTLGVMVVTGMRTNGAFGYWKGLIPGGVPVLITFILIPIELLGLLTKPFALAIRLFANMLSGALVIGAFYALIFGLNSVFVAPVSIAFLIFMSVLKLFVCLLQAYIFTILSAFFIGMSIHQEH